MTPLEQKIIKPEKYEEFENALIFMILHLDRNGSMTELENITKMVKKFFKQSLQQVREETIKEIVHELDCAKLHHEVLIDDFKEGLGKGSIFKNIDQIKGFLLAIKALKSDLLQSLTQEVKNSKQK